MRSPNSKLTFGRLAACILALSLLLPGCAEPTTDDHGATVRPEMALRQAMRRLWEDHITWTRLVIVSTAAGLPDLDATTHRLLQNQTDIGNAIKPYYGEAAGEKLTTLLKEHIMLAAELVAAAKAGETAKMSDANGRWKTNADAIAVFLSGANPKHWPQAEMEQMMREHLSVTTAEVQARLKGDWTADIAAYDRVHEQILAMADMLSAGVAKQFPEKLK